MTDQQPEALFLADAITHPEGEPTWETCVKAAAELRRLHAEEMAAKEWHNKTEWVQATAQAHELGMHRADVLRQRIERLTAINSQLLEALEGCDYFGGRTTSQQFEAAIDALRERLARQEQEPVGNIAISRQAAERVLKVLGWYGFDCPELRANFSAPQPADDAFKRGYEEGLNDTIRNGVDWARQYFGAAPQPAAEQEPVARQEQEQEPVAWLDEEINCAYTPEELDGGSADGLLPLYTAPQPAVREWVGLTKDEIDAIGSRWVGYQSYESEFEWFYDAVNDKLREKNGDKK